MLFLLVKKSVSERGICGVFLQNHIAAGSQVQSSGRTIDPDGAGTCFFRVDREGVDKSVLP